MGSKLFSQFEVDREENKQFRSDLAVAMSLPQSQRSAVLDAFPDYIVAIDNEEKKSVLRKLVATTSLTQTAIAHAFDLITFLLRQLNDEEVAADSSDAWAEDLVHAGALTDDQRAVFVEFVSRLRTELAPGLHAMARARREERGVLPFLRSTGTTVELRAITRSIYRWGTPVEDYRSSIEGVVPVVSIQLGFDSGMPSDVAFQMSVPLTERLIASLRAALEDVRALQSRTKLLSEAEL
jgi:hypothetical protein